LFPWQLEPPEHALHALTMHELKARHRELSVFAMLTLALAC
jgi:hypothetical protein